LLQKELEARGITSRSSTSTSGRMRGSKPFSRGALYRMFQNRIYRGEIVHKGQSHPGEHKPIIDQPLWDAVQVQLLSNAAEHNSGARTRQPSLLAGILFDADGNRMTPTHAAKKGTRYRYYVSRPLITNDQTESPAGLRLPAVEIEELVTSRVRQWLLDPGSVYQATSAWFSDPVTQRRLATRAQEIGKRWPELPMMRRRVVLNTLILIDRIDVGVGRIDIRLRSARLGELLDVAATPLPSVTDDEIQILSIPVWLRRSGSEIRMLIDGTDPFAAPKPDARLIKLLLKAHRFGATLVGSDGVPFAALAEGEGVSRSYFTRIIRLSYLAPDITQAILDGRQPPDLTADKLLAHSRLPLAWQDQRTLLGFA
jgi:site-specific DNA recombinase